MSDKVGPNPGPVRMQKCLAAGEKLPEAEASALGKSSGTHKAPSKK
jgi:hypothetical protein